MSKEADKPLSVRILPDIFAFSFWLVLAFILKWQAKDLVWSLWLSSLVTGYLTILSILAAGGYFGVALMSHPDFDRTKLKGAILMGAGVGLFLLVFFSIHFCGFHAGHSVFLSAFFPIEGMPNDGFGEAFMNPPLLWYLVFKHLMAPYGLFLIPAIIAERQRLLSPLMNAIRLKRVDMAGLAGAKESRQIFPTKDMMGKPYLNVIRMHLLIFFFAICYALKVDNFLIYAVVYAVYFFPWSEMKYGEIDRNKHEVSRLPASE